MKRAVLSLSVMFTVATSAFAGSASTTNTNNITASVAAKCTIGAFSIAFGSYDPFAAAPLDQSGTVTINCTKGTSGVVSFNLGANASGVVRRMQDTGATGNFLSYEVYTDAAHTTVWNAVNTVTLGPAVSKNTALTATAYGRVAAGQDAAVLNYQDTLVATVTF
ncbi:MAG TPA: spore coat U domain-containing protein [Thermoanaerobaculia bacterium]|nr:spore coat U domain-containing protein [Thermoanaerobaculia bacterium]